MNKIVITLLAGLVVSIFMLDASADVRSACAEDFKALCPNVKPGGGRVKSCIKEHKDQLSTACKSALAEKAKQKQ